MRDTDTVPMTLLRAPFEARTWRELAYVLVGVALSCIAAVYLFVGFATGGLFAIVLIGIPVLVATIVGGRVWGELHRWLCATLLRTPIDAPAPFTQKPGILGLVRSGLTDPVGWRAVVYLTVKSVFGAAAGFFALLFAATAALFTVSPIIWWLEHPINIDSNGVERRSMIQIDDFYFDTLPRMLLLASVGLVCLFLAPWPIRAWTAIDVILVRGLLGETKRDKRLQQLQETRTTAVEDSAATLRRVERDLHDGTQARLVTNVAASSRRSST